MRYYRRNPDNDYSPGNFRRPTLEKCQDYLDWWADQGVTKLSDLNTFDMTAEERALDKIRWSEAKYYWDRYQKQLGRHATDSYVYRKPLLSTPDPDAEDYGDFEAVSAKASQNYLYNFFTRQAERTEAGLPLQDVELYPWKPRYDESVAMLGQDEVDQLEQEIDERHGLAIYRRNPDIACVTCGLTNCPCGCFGDPSLCTCRRRRNPGIACVTCGLVDCPCGCDGDPSLCTCRRRRNPGIACYTCGLASCPCWCFGDPSKCTCRGRRNPDFFDSLADKALDYAYTKDVGRRRNPYHDRDRPSMPW